MSKLDIEEAAQFAETTLTVTIDVALRYFHAMRDTTHSTVEYKPIDNSPVTEADKNIEQIIRNTIAQAYPDHGIIGEEFGCDDVIKHQKYRYAWIIDPIDGTQAFIHNTPLFTTLLALFDFEIMQPILGCISIPIYNTVIYAIKDMGIWEKKQPFPHYITANTEHTHGTLYLSYDWAKVYQKAPKLLKQLFSQENTILTRTWADAFAYYLLIHGKTQLVIDPDTHVWDIAAVYPLVKEAKGILCDWNGNDIDWDSFIKNNNKDIIACSHKKHLEYVLSLI